MREHLSSLGVFDFSKCKTLHLVGRFFKSAGSVRHQWVLHRLKTVRFQSFTRLLPR